MLFNTLANLRSLIASDPVRAQTMLDHLIDFLRATLQHSRSADAPHSLAQEFARLDDYLALMAIRMGPRLHYQLDLPPALASQPPQFPNSDDTLAFLWGRPAPAPAPAPPPPPAALGLMFSLRRLLFF